MMYDYVAICIHVYTYVYIYRYFFLLFLVLHFVACQTFALVSDVETQFQLSPQQIARNALVSVDGCESMVESIQHIQSYVVSTLFLVTNFWKVEIVLFNVWEAKTDCPKMSFVRRCLFSFSFFFG